MTLLEKYYSKIAIKTKGKIKSKKMAIILFVMFFLLVAISFPYSYVNKYSSLLNFFTSFFLLLITGVYVYYTKAMVNEIINSRKIDKTPNIKMKLTSYSIIPKSTEEKHRPSGHNQFYCKFEVTNRSTNSIYELDLDIIYPGEDSSNSNQVNSLVRISKMSNSFSIPDELNGKSAVEIEVTGIFLFLTKTDYKTDSGQIEVTFRFEDEFRNLYLLKQFYGIRYYSGGETAFGFRLLLDELRVLPFNKRHSVSVSPWEYLEDIIFYKNDIIYSYSYQGYNIEY